jgi:DoxX-like family
MGIHKDCYSAIDLTQQDGPHRRETAKLAGVPFMVELFDQIGIGQWFRLVTGVVEITGAIALVFPGLASIGAA